MLLSKSLVLRPFSSSDLEVLMKIRNDIEIQPFLMSRPRGSNENDLKLWVEKKRLDDACLFLIITKLNCGTAIGYIEARNVDCMNSNAEIAICLKPCENGNGFGTEAIGLFLNYLKVHWNLKKVYLRVVQYNKIAIKSYLKLGFNKCGTFSQHYNFNGQFYDIHLMEKML